MVSFLFHSAIPTLRGQEQSLSQRSTLGIPLSCGPPLMSAHCPVCVEEPRPLPPAQCPHPSEPRWTAPLTLAVAFVMGNCSPFLLPSYLFHLFATQKVNVTWNWWSGAKNSKQEAPEGVELASKVIDPPRFGEDFNEQATHSTWKIWTSGLSYTSEDLARWTLSSYGARLLGPPASTHPRCGRRVSTALRMATLGSRCRERGGKNKGTNAHGRPRASLSWHPRAWLIYLPEKATARPKWLVSSSHST